MKISTLFLILNFANAKSPVSVVRISENQKQFALNKLNFKT